MDFLTVTSPPIQITIDGKPYSIPRFLLPDQKRWAADRAKVVSDTATAHLSKDEKTRFLMFFQSPPVDIFGIAEYSRSPEGAGEIINRQFARAGVEDAAITAIIENADPVSLRVLADALCSASQAAADAAGMSEKSADPLAGQTGASGDSPGTGQTNSENSTTTTT